MRQTNVKKIRIESAMRGYTYTAVISRVTNRLLYIHAGCRTWRTFEAARFHYSVSPAARNENATVKWSDAWVAAQAMQLLGGGQRARDKAWAHRYEARCILDKLERKVHKAIRRMNMRRKAKRR